MSQPNETETYKHDPEAQKKLREMAKNIDIAMLTTVDTDGTLRSRPMSTNGEVEFDGDLWFFTYGSSHKVDEIERQPKVNVAFSDTRTQTYISISGTAELVRDEAKIKELWKPELKAWFPKGTDEPDIALLKVSGVKAEYWDSPSGIVATAVGLVKSLTTGKAPSEMGDHEKISLT
ncbi:MAG: pyridoxamine 5'-phosphate oxidase family protein [Fibrella sp.]|nr:pyridoxamine 5'-phosphate oxidase family protein [Armatimonadota bacterium]